MHSRTSSPLKQPAGSNHNRRIAVQLRVRVLATFILPALAYLSRSWLWGASVQLRSPMLQPQSSLSYKDWLSNLPEPGKIEWLHIPKTGTTFGNSLVLWACPELPPRRWAGPKGVKGLPDSCLSRFRTELASDQRAGHFSSWQVGDHVSLENRTDAELARVFTMVRSPKARLVSGYHFLADFYHLHRYFPADARPLGGANASAERICAHARASAMPHSALGAQARIIAGERMTLNETRRDWWQFFASAAPQGQAAAAAAVAAEACRRVKLLAFVGLTEEWKASVCLFHEVFGGGEIRGFEMANTRPGGYTKDGGTVQEVDCGDTADEQLYACAVEVFRARLRQHPRCERELVQAREQSPATRGQQLQAS